jgi:hypothetical protein
VRIPAPPRLSARRTHSAFGIAEAGFGKAEQRFEQVDVRREMPMSVADFERGPGANVRLALTPEHD